MNLYEYVGNDPVNAWDPTGFTFLVEDSGINTILEIAGKDCSVVSIAGGLVTIDATEEMLASNDGLMLLNQLSTSEAVYFYDEGSVIETQGGSVPIVHNEYQLDVLTNLDNLYDKRGNMKDGISPFPLPVDRVDAAIVVNPNVPIYNSTLEKKVSTPSQAFHELSEALGRVDQSLPYQAAHDASTLREQSSQSQRPGFTEHLAGEGPLKQRQHSPLNKEMMKRYRAHQKKIRNYQKEIRKAERKRKN